MKPEKEYLNQMIAETKKKFDEFVCIDLDLSSANVSYIPTKKRNWMGLKLGLEGQAEMKKYKVTESQKIRSNCTFYHRIYKLDDKIAKIDCFVNGRIDVSYIAHYEENYRYLFPFNSEKKYPYTYTIVTHFENDQVIEEYMVKENQIIYEKYGSLWDGQVAYYCINYVPTGKYPVLGETMGYYKMDTLEYVPDESYVWNQQS